MVNQTLPSENELLFKTWEQIKSFMNEITSTYIKYNYPEELARKEAVQWGDKIFNSPLKIDTIVTQEWPQKKRTLKLKFIVQKTSQELEHMGVPASLARDHAIKYAQEMVNIEEKSGILPWITGQQPPEMMTSTTNLQNLAREYYQRIHADQNQLPPPLKLPSLYSSREVYQYVKESLLKGEWFPFVAYSASKKAQYRVTPPSFAMDPVDFQQAMIGDRTQSKILWNNIFKLVGVVALTTIIYHSLKMMYKKYRNFKYDRTVLIYLSHKNHTTDEITSQLDDFKKEFKLIDSRKPYKIVMPGIKMYYKFDHQYSSEEIDQLIADMNAFWANTNNLSSTITTTIDEIPYQNLPDHIPKYKTTFQIDVILKSKP